MSAHPWEVGGSDEQVSKTSLTDSIPFLSLSPLSAASLEAAYPGWQCCEMKGAWISEGPGRVELHLPPLLTTLAGDVCKQEMLWS